MKKIALVAVAFLVLVAAALSGSPEESSEPVEPAPEAGVARDTRKPEDPRERVREALREEFGDDLRRVALGRAVEVHLDADENLTTGMMRTGMDQDAYEALNVLYGEAGYPKAREVDVVLYLPLTDTRTGEESVDPVARYSLGRPLARRIKWGTDGAQYGVKWETHRVFLHPAVR